MIKVSVIIPNYNHEPFLRKRIESVLNQTYQDFEVIILDDCSTDNSREVIEQYHNHPRISHIVFNEKNSGSPFKQWNKGINLATGTYIWLAESDDFAEANLLSTLVEKLEANPQVGIAYSNSRIVDENDYLLEAWDIWMEDIEPTKWKQESISNGREEIENYAIIRNTIPNASGVVFRKSLYQAVGGANSGFRYLGDWDLWLRMLERTDVAYVPECLNYFRRHTGTTRNSYKVPGSGYITEVYRCLAPVYKHKQEYPPLFYKTLNDLFYLWHQESVKVFWKNFTWRNYKLASQVDAALHTKILKFAGNYFKMKLSGAKTFKA